MAESSFKRADNVLFITSDQQHWMTMGYLNPEVKTPNLDRLVEMGTSFHRAYTPNPTCTPTRASWITGMYPSQHGAWSLGTKLPENVPTIGDALKENGIATALVGKAHFQPLLQTDRYSSLESYPVLHDLDFWKDFHGPFYGFDHVELARNHTDESHVGQHYALWMESKGYTDWRKFFKSGHEMLPEHENEDTGYKSPAPGEPWQIPEEIHYNQWITERTGALMSDYATENKRFFLWASFFDPHPIYMVPEPYASLYDPEKVTAPEFKEGEFDDKPDYFMKARDEKPDFTDYQEPGGAWIHGSGKHLQDKETRAKNIAAMYGMVTMLDAYIGKLLQKLDELGLTEKTLVCFTTDHGDYFGQHGLTKKAIHHYEDLIKVPLVVSQPGSVPMNEKKDCLQSTVDLASSFLSALGIEVPGVMTGIDETPVWYGETKELRDHALVENRHQPTKLYMNSLVTSQYKLTVHYQRPYGELYDLEADPHEYTNLWDNPEHQEIKHELFLKFINAEMGKAPMWMPRITGA